MKSKDLLQINFKNKIVAMVVFSLIVIIFLIFFAILPAIENLSGIKTRINNRKAELKEKSFQTDDIKKYFEEKRSVEERISVLDTMLLNQDNSLDFTNGLEMLAAGNNVIDKISLLQNKSEEIGKYRRIPITFTVEGNLAGLMSYLAGLENMKYYINVNSLELTSQSVPQETEQIIVMRLSAHTYWEK